MWSSIALVSVTLWVERISFIKKECALGAGKSSFSFGEKWRSEIRAKIA
jgi:hypothetical protein